VSTLTEQILARVKTVLIGATAAGSRVLRDRADDLPADDELPCIVVSRAGVDSALFGDASTRNTCTFRLICYVKGADRDAQLDALHKAATSALLSDSLLLALGRGFHCSGTDEPEHFSGDPTVARMSATYQLTTLTRTGDLSRAL